MKIIRFVLIILIVLGFPSHPAVAQRGDASDVEAAGLLKQVIATYHSLSTYSDRGTAIVHMTSSDSVYKIEFETLFKRPNKVRFAWTLEFNHTPGHKQTGVIWCDGETAWTWYSFRDNNLERKANLEAAMASATGASWGTAPNILELLVDRFQEMIRLDERAAFKIAGKDLANGVECMKLVGTETDGDELKVWIGREDHLIRRVQEKMKGWSGYEWKWKGATHEEMHTDIVVNQEIADSRFSKEGRY
jgi:outer membrane lipoprotein-sorting protein